MIGIDPTTVPSLDPDPVPPADRYTDFVPDKEARLLSAAPAGWREDDWFPGWTWNDRWKDVSVDVLRRAFTFGELARIWTASVVTSRLSDWFEAELPLLEKARHSLVHCRAHDNAYNHLAAGVAGLRRLTWPGAEVRLAFCSKYRGDGHAEELTETAACSARHRPRCVTTPAEHVAMAEVSKDRSVHGREKRSCAPFRRMLWLDNDLGALIHVAGEHVLTVGFGLGAGAVYITQVQLREKRGNRWLYRLPAHYLDMALEMMASAFHDHEVWLVDGRSAVDAVRRSYGGGECGLTEEAEARIAALYDRPLAAFDRTEDTARAGGRDYKRLLRRQASARAA